jgi:GNAT superfamily N-acetyltransferase
MRIRKASAGDVDAVIQCLASAFEPYRTAYTTAAFADTVPTPEGMRHRLADMTLFVAVTDRDDVVGTIGCQVVSGEEGHLRGMAVRPDSLGDGTARLLLQAAEVELREKGCSRISLDTTAPLRRAIRFYERNGFRPTGTVRDFFGMELFEYVKELG